MSLNRTDNNNFIYQAEDGQINVSNKLIDLLKLLAMKNVKYDLYLRKKEEMSLSEFEKIVEDSLIDYDDDLAKYNGMRYRLLVKLVSFFVPELDKLYKTITQHEKNALDYCNAVISNEKKVDTLEYKKKVAFAKLIMGCIECKNSSFDKAESYYRSALEFYETNDAKDERHIKLKNTLAQVVDKQAGRDKDASKIFSEVSEYWNKLEYNRNLYAAKHFIVYAKHKLKNGYFNESAELIQKAISIYNSTHDKNHRDYSIFSELPQLSKEIYTKLSRHEQDKNKVLKSYISPMHESDRYPFYFWKTKKEMAVGVTTLAVIGSTCAFAVLRNL